MFQNGSGLEVGLVLFGAIAVFLILRLRSVLGKRVGFERPPAGSAPRGFGNAPVIEGQAQAVVPGRPVPDPRSALGEKLMRIVNADPNFDPPKFLETAEQSFRTIVTAFAAGDRGSLKNLLSPPVFQTFEGAISAREAAGERHRAEIRTIVSATIEEAELMSDHAAIIVRFVSDQVSLTQDKAGEIISGSEAISELVDLWTFEKKLGKSETIWRLAAARSS